MTSTIERQASLVVGTVEAVAPDQIRVLLDLDAPYVTAFNTGTPTPFPRLNGYVLIPNEAGATVGYVAWIGIERSPYPKRTGLKDFGLIDLPFPLRKMLISPVGTLTSQRDRSTGATKYELSRGVTAFPSVGDQVLIPTVEQIEAIVGAKESDKRVRIGVSPMSASAAIMIDPDKLFGRHLAVLGNTGSGKSCTVAGLIRWSLDAAKEKIDKRGEGGQPNARFIVLDPNGEYSKAFSDLGTGWRLFRVPPVRDNERPLDIPAWAWNGHEWTAVAHAQPGAQRRVSPAGTARAEEWTDRTDPAGGDHPPLSCVVLDTGFSDAEPRHSGIRRIGSGTFSCARLLERIAADVQEFAASVADPAQNALALVSASTTQILESRRSNNPQFFEDFAISDLESVREQLDSLIADLPDLGNHAPISEDAPLHFDVNMLGPHLKRIATDQGANVAGFVSTLGLRIRGMLSDQRLGPSSIGSHISRSSQWLDSYVGESRQKMAKLQLSIFPLFPPKSFTSSSRSWRV